jgi:uncharacterized membrane protein YedE/YeeE
VYALVSFVVGLVFAIGLLVAGMASPAKILAFLDLAGAWDPSLALVMGAAIVVGVPGFYLARSRTRSVLGTPMLLPPTTAIDRRLLAGSVLFGVGWGLAGFCPGPALVAVGAGEVKGAVFVAFMLAGMLVADSFESVLGERGTRLVTGSRTNSFEKP